MTTQLKLSPDAVRERSRGVPDCTEVPTTNSDTTISFVVGASSGKTSQLARVTVYCETGTIAVGRILLGTMRQTFRRNISSLDVVERLLRKPPALTNIHPDVMSVEDENDEEKKVSVEPKRFAKIVKENVELINVGMAILQGERERLAQHAKSLEPPPPPPVEESTSAPSESTDFQFSLPEEHMKHVDQCLADIESMGRLVRSVATNGKGTVFLYGKGGVAYTPAIPKALYHKLSQFRKKSSDVNPSYVSLGTRERFFISFSDDTFAFKGPKGLERELKHARKRPLSVAFGGPYETFFVVFEDGSWYYNGKSVPRDLQSKLSAREDRPDLVCVNLGPAGEWFLRARNGRIWWGGISEEMDETIQGLLDEGHYLNFLDFGEDGSYFISYD